MRAFFRSSIFVVVFLAGWALSFAYSYKSVLVFFLVGLLIYGPDLLQVTRRLIAGSGQYYLARPAAVALAFCLYPVGSALANLIIISTTGFPSSYFPGTRNILTAISFVGLLFVAALVIVFMAVAALGIAMIADGIRAWLSNKLGTPRAERKVEPREPDADRNGVDHKQGFAILDKQIPWQSPFLGASILSLITLLPIALFADDYWKRKGRSPESHLIENLLLSVDFTFNASYEQNSYSGPDGWHEGGVKFYENLPFNAYIAPVPQGVIVARCRENWPVKYSNGTQAMATRYVYLFIKELPQSVFEEKLETSQKPQFEYCD